jgi:hypothetical protein
MLHNWPLKYVLNGREEEAVSQIYSISTTRPMSFGKIGWENGWEIYHIEMTEIEYPLSGAILFLSIPQTSNLVLQFP